MLGSKTLGTNVLELQFVLFLANHDQNIESRFRLAQSMFICKGSIDRKLDSINRTTCRFIFLQNSNSTQTLLKRIGF